MTIRLLELVEEWNIGTDACLLAVCALVEIHVTSRISCLTNEYIKKLIDYYQKKK